VLRRPLPRSEWRDKNLDEDFKRRERETLAHNSRLLDGELVRQEKDVDARLRRLTPWSDKWVVSMNHANALRRRRIALLPNMGAGS